MRWFSGEAEAKAEASVDRDKGSEIGTSREAPGAADDASRGNGMIGPIRP